MIINSFEISNIILDETTISRVSDSDVAAYLMIVDEEPRFSVNWSNKLTIDDHCKPFAVAHPVFKKYTFKIFGHKYIKQHTFLFDFLNKKTNIKISEN
jgi:hypothetical protein